MCEHCETISEMCFVLGPEAMWRQTNQDVQQTSAKHCLYLPTAMRVEVLGRDVTVSFTATEPRR